MFCGGGGSFIHSSVRRVIPNRCVVFFETTYLCSDVCLLIQGSARWVLTLINRVVTPTSTLFCSFSTMVLRTSTSVDLERFNFAPPPIYLWITWRDVSLSVKSRRSIWSSCASKHSLRATSSGRFELRPSSSLSTLLDSRSRCSYRSSCVSGVLVFHCMVLKLL